MPPPARSFVATASLFLTLVVATRIAATTDAPPAGPAPGPPAGTSGQPIHLRGATLTAADTDGSQAAAAPGAPAEVPEEVPNPVEGFGRLDVTAALLPHEDHDFTPARRMLVEDVGSGLDGDVEQGLATAESRTHRFEVIETADPLRITLA